MKKLFLLFLNIQMFCSSHGQTWSAVGNGVSENVNCFAIYNGELYAGGLFGLLKWNGVSFDTLPGNYLLGSAVVNAMAVYNNELYFGGGFDQYGYPVHSAFNDIAKWNGTSFDSLGSGCYFVVYSMAVYNGNLYVGGDIELAGSVYTHGIARWNGSDWFAVGSGLDTRVNVLEVYNNELYAGGDFQVPNLNIANIARWNDTIWQTVGTGGAGSVSALEIYNNDLYCGRGGIEKWNGTTWTYVGSGIGDNGIILALKDYHNELYAGGDFSVMDGDSIKSIARYNGVVWDSVGSGVDSANIIIDTIFGFPVYAPHTISAFQEFNDELYVGGTFNMIGGVAAHNIAKWSAPVGIPEINNSNFDFLISPNPATSKINIYLSSTYQSQQLKITNTLGQTIQQQTFSTNQLQLDISTLPSGVYFIELQNEKGRAAKKFMKD